jgi:hypothetical protein
MIARVSLFACALALCFAAHLRAADDDPDIFIHSSSYDGEAFKLVWAVKRSRLAAVPLWHEMTDETPISPHRAVTAATEFLRSRLGASVNLRVVDITMFQHGLELNAVVADLWAYTIDFESDPEPNRDDRPLLGVMVLMDGKVVVPVRQPAK